MSKKRILPEKEKSNIKKQIEHIVLSQNFEHPKVSIIELSEKFNISKPLTTDICIEVANKLKKFILIDKKDPQKRTPFTTTYTSHGIKINKKAIEQIQKQLDNSSKLSIGDIFDIEVKDKKIILSKQPYKNFMF